MATHPTISRVLHLTDDSFKEVIERSIRPILVEFYSHHQPVWRGITDDALLLLARRFQGRMMVANLRTDQAPEIAERYGVGRFPNTFLFSRGEVLHQFVGSQTMEQLVTVINYWVDPRNNPERR